MDFKKRPGVKAKERDRRANAYPAMLNALKFYATAKLADAADPGERARRVLDDLRAGGFDVDELSPA